MKFLKKLKVGLFLLAMTTFITDCKSVKGNLDQQDDIAEGKVFVSRFYSAIKNKNFDGLDEMVSDTLKKIVGPKGISHIASTINSKVGDYRNYTITRSHTQQFKSSENEIVYNYMLQVTYEKGVIVEALNLKKTKQSAIKVIAYNVYSDLLVN